MDNFIRGLKAGIPISLGYLSVSFAFGLQAVASGFSCWQAVLISLLTVTSAGQFSGIQTMMVPGQYFDMLISQITINIRYSFMSVSISQKVDEKFKGIYRWLLGFFMTDEIFAVAASQKTVTRSFFAGLATLPWLGWTLGTLIGALLGEVLPKAVLRALGLAIYGMFIAIVVPELKKNNKLILVVLLAAILSLCFKFLPFLKEVSSGISITVCAVVSAVVAALIFPRESEDENES